MTSITKERAELKAFITGFLTDPMHDDQSANSLTAAVFRIALASLEAEESGRNPVLAYADSYRDMAELGVKSIPVWSVVTDLERNIAPLFTAPPAVPDEHYQILSDLYHAQEKRLFKLAQRIKGPSFDKYAHSPSQAIDVLESAIFGEREDEACRASMLQGGTDGVKESNNLLNTARFCLDHGVDWGVIMKLMRESHGWRLYCADGGEVLTVPACQVSDVRAMIREVCPVWYRIDVVAESR